MTTATNRSPNVVKYLVASQKGGVLKSTVVAALSGELASANCKVLVVDGDMQGNVTARDFGVEDPGMGRGLATCMLFGGPLQVMNARENLDVVPGGMSLGGIPAQMAAQPANQQGLSMAPLLAYNLGGALDALAAENGYTHIVIDAGPGDTLMLEGYMMISDYLIIPTMEDEGSIDGAYFIQARAELSQQADIDLLGVVLTGVNPQATKRNAAAVQNIAERFGASTDIVFRTTIGQHRAGATDMRRHNLIPSDFRANARGEVVFQNRLDAGELANADMWSTAKGVRYIVEDHRDLALEVIQRTRALQQAAYLEAAPAVAGNQEVAAG